MLVFVTTTLSNILTIIKNKLLVNPSKKRRTKSLTDFTTGPFAITVVLKLKGPAAVESTDPLREEVVISAGPALKLKDAFVGLRRS